MSDVRINGFRSIELRNVQDGPANFLITVPEGEAVPPTFTLRSAPHSSSCLTISGKCVVSLAFCGGVIGGLIVSDAFSEDAHESQYVAGCLLFYGSVVVGVLGSLCWTCGESREEQEPLIER